LSGGRSEKQPSALSRARIRAARLAAAGQTAPTAPAFSVTVLAQSPADTKTDLQIFCLFRSSPENQLHGSLTEIDAKLHGLLTQVRQPGLFGGELGETMLLTPPPGSIGAKKVLIIGLGDSSTFAPERMYLAGKIAFREANRLGIAHPFFAPTVLDGGVSGFPTGAVAYQVVRGLRDALATETVLRKSQRILSLERGRRDISRRSGPCDGHPEGR
jgi:hypothetical protein